MKVLFLIWKHFVIVSMRNHHVFYGLIGEAQLHVCRNSFKEPRIICDDVINRFVFCLGIQYSFVCILYVWMRGENGNYLGVGIIRS